MSRNGTLGRIAFIGSYPPRQCGIATFTSDLCEAIAAQAPQATCFALPVNDNAGGYAYPARVRFELMEADLDSYLRAADFLNTNNVDLVCLQHEFGIYGGRAGSHVLALLRELRMPVVTTLHTVLREPDPDQRRVMDEIAARCDCLVVMSQRGREFLREVYHVPDHKIAVIPHGIPEMPFVDPNFHKDRFGVEGKTVMLTFGLLSANKGIENVICALPPILERHPNLVYIILGATHPHVRRREGETYRLSLQRLAQEKGVDGHVIFHNRFVSLEELIEFIGAADIYITPNVNQQQIVSGTLAYALGAGKAVVSTPYWYAEEMLADGRGVLVPFNAPEALAERILDLLADEPRRHAIRKRAYLFSREMVWPQVAARYLECFERVRAERLRFPGPGFSTKALDRRPAELPLLNLNHLRRMTDHTGLLQHAVYAVPNYREGYTTDDNARALIVSILLEELNPSDAADAGELTARYLAFLWYAFHPETRRCRNHLDYQRTWRDAQGSDDSNGRALWALGNVLGRSSNSHFRSTAAELFEQSLPAVLETTSPRAWAFAVFGVQEYLRRFGGDRIAAQARNQLASRLLELHRRTRTPDWPWFEDRLSYCNAALPQALISAGRSWQMNRCWPRASKASPGWLRSSAPKTVTSPPSAQTASTCGAANAPASISSRPRRRRWSAPA